MALRDRLASAKPANPASDGGNDRGGLAKIAGIAIAAPSHSGKVTPAEEAEIRAGIGRLCGFDHADFPEALAVALADPRAALDALRNPSARMLASLEGER
jgi:hypothetical protein